MKGANAGCERDLAARAMTFIAIWVAPLALAGLFDLLWSEPFWLVSMSWGAVLGWMGIACLLNARRSGRMHCYFSGPILLLGALLSLALAGGVLDLGANGAPTLVAVTLALAVLTYGLEPIMGRYRGQERSLAEHDGSRDRQPSEPASRRESTKTPSQ